MKPSDDVIYDKYGMLDSKEKHDDDKEDSKKDLATIKREDFLSIYKESDNVDVAGDQDAPDLSNGIRFKRDEDSDPSFDLMTSVKDSKAGRPLI